MKTLCDHRRDPMRRAKIMTRRGRGAAGQAATEYLIATAALLLALLAMEPNALAGLLDAFAQRYASLSFAVSMP